MRAFCFSPSALLTQALRASQLARMESFSEYAKILRAGRALTGLSQDELAQLAGISRQIVVRIEGGHGNVSLYAVEQVQRTLEELGVVFLAETSRHGRGVSMAKP